MQKTMRIIGTILCAVFLVITGCQNRTTSGNNHKPDSLGEKPKTTKTAKAPAMKLIKRTDTEDKGKDSSPKSLPVEIPEEVQARYDEVKLHLAKKDGSFQKDFTVKLNEETPLDDSGLSVKVSAFLPAFYMDQNRITSVGAKATNPACKITIQEKGKEIHTGWLFAKMPQVHAFEHEIYALTLIDGGE